MYLFYTQNCAGTSSHAIHSTILGALQHSAILRIPAERGLRGVQRLKEGLRYQLLRSEHRISDLVHEHIVLLGHPRRAASVASLS